MTFASGGVDSADDETVTNCDRGTRLAAIVELLKSDPRIEVLTGSLEWRPDDDLG